MIDSRWERPDIVCLSTNHWTGLPTSKQHLTWVLSRKRRVLYVDPPIDVFSALGRPRRWPKLRGLRRAGHGAWVLSPLTVAGPFGAAARAAFHAEQRRRVRAVTDRLGFEHPVLWTFTPEHGAYVGHLDESLTIYHIADDLPAMSSDPESARELERQHVERADLVFVVSEALLDRERGTGKAHRLPNAADARHYGSVLAGNPDVSRLEFEGAVAKPRIVPREFENARRPILLYGGATYQWFDTELFLELARTKPRWTFAFVGPTKGRLAQGGLPANVLRVGRRSYGEFPWYVAGADAAIMPWKDDAITRAADPIMLYEYLLCGKPVVATPFPAALERRDLVRTAGTAEAFLAAVEDALSEKRGSDLGLRRMAFGFENTWESRAEAALGHVLRALEERGVEWSQD